MNSEWTLFSTNLMHLKQWRSLSNGRIEIHEEIPIPSTDMSSLLLQCEQWKKEKFFSIPNEFTKNKNPIIMHNIAIAKSKDEIEYCIIHIDTIIEIKYIKKTFTF